MPFPLRSLAALALAATSFSAAALEYPIGSPQNLAGMEVAAVYLQAVEMEPEGHMRKASESDIHLEADIHALANNANGFAEGMWVPHLLVKYELTRIGTNEVIKGDMMPMVASDGPHHLVSDAEPISYRHTAAGDAWESRQGRTQVLSVGLGMPTLGAPAPLPPAPACAL